MAEDQFLRIIKQAQAQIVDQSRVNFHTLIQTAVVAAGDQADGMIRYIAENFGPEFQRKNLIPFTNAHLHVGRAAMRSVQTAFSHRRFRRPVARYRAGDNRLSGKLAQALRSPTHIDRGISHLRIINTSALDREAAHWRRLNFGAGAGGREGIIAPQQFPVTWEGVAVGTFGLESDPSPGFTIPFGFWLGPDGGQVGANSGRLGMDQFFPGRAPAGTTGGGRMQRRRPTAGIASRNFMDAAVRTVANDLPRAYETIFRDAFAKAEGELGAMARPQTITRQWRRPNRGTSFR